MTRGACDEFGDRTIADIKPSEILTMLREVDAPSHLDAATEIRSTVSRVFRYAIVTDRADRDPAADLKGALKTAKVRHMPAILEPEPFGKLVRSIAGYSSSAITRQALRLAPIVFVRPGELRQPEWAENDWKAREWRMPAEKMKMRRMHIVPLARQALAILEELKPMTGDGRLLFPSPRTDKAPLSDGTLNMALRRMGYLGDEVVAYGFRRTASTMLNEHGWEL